jgi:hypothetical protein
MKTSNSVWKGIDKIGGIAALIITVLYFAAIVIYVPAYSAAPTPSTVSEWFTLLQKHLMTGLFFLGLADIIIVIAWVPLALSLYASLQYTNKAWASIAAVLSFIGTAVFLATNIAFSMYALSRQFLAATTELEEMLILAAGQTVLANDQSTGTFTGYALVWIAALIFSVVSWKSNFFSKVSAVIGIIGFGLLIAGVPFSGYTFGPPPESPSAIVAIGTGIIGGLLSLVWYIMMGVQLLRNGRSEEMFLLSQQS